MDKTPEIKKDLALQKMRAELEGKRGQEYWRTMDEVSHSPEFQAWFEDEFPNRKDLLTLDRRTLLKFAGASLALAGLSGCRGVFLPEEKLVPYVKAPEEMVPGKALFYASAVTLAGYATGVLVEQHEGRPIKLEGNPDHPASLGALGSISQAEVLNFYDPDRLETVVEKEEISTWEEFQRVLSKQLESHVATGGKGVSALFGAITSPTLGSLIGQFQKKFPAAKIYSWEPVGRSSVTAAVTSVTGKPGVPVYDFSNAKVVVSLDGDFLSNSDNPGALVYARQFSASRRVVGTSGEMSRLYSIEANSGLVGAMADHRYMVKPSQVYAAACALASALGVTAPAGEAPGALKADLAAIVKDLKAHVGHSVIVAGEHQPVEVHTIAFLMNNALGNVGKTVKFVTSPEVSAGFGTISDLAKDLSTGLVDILYISNSNPVYTAPSDLKFAENLSKAKLKISLASSVDETSKLCDWTLPLAHSLEVWGDARSFEGTATIMQPIIAPLFDGRSEMEVFSTVLGVNRGGFDLLRTFWKTSGLGAGDFEKNWRTAVHAGMIPGTASASLAMTTLLPTLPPVSPSSAGMEASFIPDSAVYDGRFANNGWLQELPRPLTKVVWDNVVTLSPADAEELKVKTDEMVKVTTDAGEIDGIVYVLPGQAKGSVTMNLGYGRTGGGTLATIGVSNGGDQGGGFSSYKLRTSKNLAFTPITAITSLNTEQHLASTQGHSPLGGSRMPDKRDILRVGTLAGFLEAVEESKKEKDDHKRQEKIEESLKIGESPTKEEIIEGNLYPEEVFEWDGDQWGMTIDMNACTGCGACVTACQAENNISVVGKEQVAKGREMHWIRLDRYYSGSDENPEVVWQPIACVHCEKAPCEPVCPVAATIHSHEGLNQMVYNRCVGTRYCSNNCPYKVRRFNYLNWSDNQAQFTNNKTPYPTRVIPGPIKEPKPQGVQLLKLLNNPDVTVRGRGVMEKCTYCVQRINEARIESKKGGRQIEEGDILTACQQSCPSEAIVFGNIANPSSKVSKLRSDPRSYLLLEELQTRPRTSHLAKLRNPNPEITPAKKREAHS